MSCAADEPGTERGRRRPLGGARERRAGGGEPGAPPRGAAGPQTGAARPRGASLPLAKCPAPESGETTTPAEPSPPGLLPVSPLPWLGGEGRAGEPPNVSLSRLLGDADVKRAGGFAEGATRAAAGTRLRQRRREMNWGAGRGAPGNVQLPGLGPRESCSGSQGHVLGGCARSAPRVAGPSVGRQDSNH